MKALSIVIVSYNTVHLLEECLHSVYSNCERDNVEVFVVDNASSDGSQAMVRQEFPEARLISNDNNLGFASANNQAIALAVGRHILLLNSDTIILGDVLSRSVDYMDANPRVAVFGCRVLNPDRSLQLTCSRVPSILNLFLQLSGLCKLKWPKWFGRFQMTSWDRSSEKDVDVVSGCYMMVRHAAIDNVGLLDEAFFFFAEETDWCRRFKESKWRVVFAPVGEIVHYGSASAMSLGHERDLLLTNGLIRYHRKHSGLVSAMVVWVMLLAFAASRFLFWAIANILTRTKSSESRRRHFLRIILDYSKAWPST